MADAARSVPESSRVEHAVLQHLGERDQVGELAVVEPGQHGVGDVADAGLDRQQPRRHPSGADLVAQEVHQVPGDRPRGVVGGAERRVAVGAVRLDHGDDLVAVDVQVRLADALQWLGEHDRAAVRRQRGAVVDVVEALQLARLPVVDLEDYPVGLIEPGLVVAHRRAGHQQPVRQGRGHLHDRHVELAVEAEPHVLRGVAQVGVDVANSPALIMPRSVGSELYGSRVEIPWAAASTPSASGAVDAPVHSPTWNSSSVVVGPDHGCGERGGDRLGIAGAGEPAEPHVVAVVDVRHSLFGRDDLRG